MSTQPEPDKEILAITATYAALKDIDAPAQLRVIEYVMKKLDLPLHVYNHQLTPERKPDEIASVEHHNHRHAQNDSQKDASDDEFPGISPIAQRWIQRNGLTAKEMSSIFSLGGDEIDLVANKVPGKSNRARMHCVFLLKGVAAYLGSGAARFAHDQVKETCVHYDAYDVGNFAKHLKDFAPEVSGSKESGYTLTARGLSAAADLVKMMIKEKKTD